MVHLRAIDSPLICQVRGLLIVIEHDAARCDGHDAILALVAAAILTKETDQTTIRLAPPR